MYAEWTVLPQFLEFPIEGISVYFVLLSRFTDIPVLNANCVYLDQTSRFVSSDLGSQCLPMSFLLLTLEINRLIMIQENVSFFSSLSITHNKLNEFNYVIPIYNYMIFFSI